MVKKKIIRVGFDLDGVVVGRPPLIPKKLLEWLFMGSQKGSLHYRFPRTGIEQSIRKLSHFYFFRPPIRQNIAFIKKIHQRQGHELYLISSRYSFLQKETHIWLKKRKVNNLFIRTYFNLKDKQPHFFKEEQLKKLAIDVYFEDDKWIVDYLCRRVGKTKIYWVGGVGKKRLIKEFFQKYRE